MMEPKDAASIANVDAPDSKPSVGALLVYLGTRQAPGDGLLRKLLRVARLALDAPHAALCKRGFTHLYDPTAPCTCWKAEVDRLVTR